ncbi:Optic atrophy 3 protein [Desmophyllum pertusum]|uniref:Optic atrophy 3 protein n=1 Tax=Desmophyllum pertusum TaxID=174260 RepID=A0A9W9Z9E1_9CNID|nr:Optic atrophy 3 protein [Desmophyllum pertusum]
MVVGAFPLFKLASLAIKQISKPIAFSLKTTARQSDFFRKYVCIWPGQGYHWLETRVKMRLMGLAGPAKVEPLSEQAAVDVGAELLGESLVFGVATVIMYLEYKRGQRKEAMKEQEQNERLFELHDHVKELELLVETNAAQVRELTRLVHSKDS